MSSIYTSGTQLGVLPAASEIYTSVVQLGTVPTENEVSSDDITVTAEAGVTIPNLVVGTYYSVEVTGGPWKESVFGSHNNYHFHVSNDGGSSWSGAMGWSGVSSQFFTNNPAWSTSIVDLDGLRGRMSWRATTTSIKIRVADGAGQFADNHGDLGWLLREGLGVFTSGVRLG